MKNNYVHRKKHSLSSCTDSFEKVIKKGICVGCGICAGIFPETLKMGISSHGEYHPILHVGADLQEIQSKVELICPFTGVGENEDVIGRREFGHLKGIRHSSELGYFLSTHAAWVTNDTDRIASSAGGIATWLVKYLIKNKLVDGVVCVTSTDAVGKLFEYRIIRTIKDLDKGRKSKYYPVELSEVIKELISIDGRFAVVALPCFIKGLRRAIQAGFLPREKFHYMIGLFCGHLKTMQFAHYLIRRCGFHENSIETVDFRKKLREEKASDYAFEVTTKNNSNLIEKRHIMMKDVLLGNWGLNAFMLKACEFCDDVVAELAGVSLGDAWLPEFIGDSRGTNIIICRRDDIRDILHEAFAKGEIALKTLEPESIILSQDAGFRQRRQALAYRLYIADKRGYWRPQKRISASAKSLKIYHKINQIIRIKLAQRSKDNFHKYHTKNDLKTFSFRIFFLVSLYNLLNRFRKSIVFFLKPFR